MNTFETIEYLEKNGFTGTWPNLSLKDPIFGDVNFGGKQCAWFYEWNVNNSLRCMYFAVETPDRTFRRLRNSQPRILSEGVTCRPFEEEWLNNHAFKKIDTDGGDVFRREVDDKVVTLIPHSDGWGYEAFCIGDTMERDNRLKFFDFGDSIAYVTRVASLKDAVMTLRFMNVEL